MMRRWLAILAYWMASLSCGSHDFHRVRRQDEASNFIWKKKLGQKTRPPRIEWVTGEDLVCQGGRGFFIDSKGTILCVSGCTWTTGVVYVAWPDGTKSIADTALAHELFHDFLFATQGDADPRHEHTGFSSDGLVYRINLEIRDMGM